MCCILSLHPTAPWCAPSMCRLPLSIAVMCVAGCPDVPCSWCRACSVRACVTDVCVTACDAVYDWCAHAVSLMRCRRRRRRLRWHSFDRSWCGGCCAVSVCAVLSVVLPACLSPHFRSPLTTRCDTACCEPSSCRLQPHPRCGTHTDADVSTAVAACHGHVSVASSWYPYDRRNATHRSQQQHDLHHHRLQ
jgi:hypothetical protein